MHLTHLRVNHMEKPFIEGRPEFSWRMEGSEKNVIQKSYRITVFDASSQIWDSGNVMSREQSFIAYGGPELAPETEYIWTVCAEDGEGRTDTLSSSFETGIAGWDAKWIESTVPRNEPKWFTYGIENPAVCFIKKFSTAKSVRKARLYASAYGVYRPFLNGKRIDDRELAPEFTPYGKILNYQIYDVTAKIKENNELKFLVGDGWFHCAQTAVVGGPEVVSPAVIFQLNIEYRDGSTEKICSDGSEKYLRSNIVFSDLFMGEKVDMTLPEPEILDVIVRDYGYKNLKLQVMPPIKAVELIPARKILTTPDGDTVVDFGQTVSGRTRIRIDEAYGTELSFEHTEVLDKEGNYFANSFARQCDTYISDGKPVVWEPAFTFHGYRYLRVKGMKDPKPEDFTAVILSTEKENAGEFSCSDERFNRLYRNIRYSQKNNMMSIPSDCPTREKAGWTGDILVYAETSLLNEDMTPFLTGWMNGLRADQQEDGVVPLISPYTKLYELTVLGEVAKFGDSRHTGMAGWSDAMVWVPWSMYKVTGNRLALEENYGAMKSWCEYIIRRAGDELIWTKGFHFGEWLVPGRPDEGFEVCKETSCYPLCSTFIFLHRGSFADCPFLLVQSTNDKLRFI